MSGTLAPFGWGQPAIDPDAILGPQPQQRPLPAYYGPVGTQTVQGMQSADGRPFDPLVGSPQAFGVPVTALQAAHLHDVANNAVNTAMGFVGSMAGPGAATADLGKLAQAQKMAQAGAERGDILRATGWFQGPEGGWRFEIPDNGMRAIAPIPAEGAPLGQVIDHPDLFAAYPQMRDTMVVPRGRPYGAGFNAGFPEDGIPPEIRFGSKGTGATMLHEMQHNIQEIENTPRGGSSMMVAGGQTAPAFAQELRAAIQRVTTPQSYDQYVQNAWGGEPTAETPAAYQEYLKAVPKTVSLDSMLGRAIQDTAAQNVYKRLAGEVEARATASRANMTPEERIATPPWQSYDVPEADMIMRYGSGDILRKYGLAGLMAGGAAAPFGWGAAPQQVQQ